MALVRYNIMSAHIRKYKIIILFFFFIENAVVLLIYGHKINDGLVSIVNPILLQRSCKKGHMAENCTDGANDVMYLCVCFY
jgi:hypothetical protein